jgi:predicted MPP superfamily phosphohydrolase
MTTSVRLIHLSDLHLGHGDCGAKAERIVGKIIEREDPDRNIVVITGDLVDRGAAADDLAAGERLLAELRGRGFTVLLCPGNHDYGTGFMNSAETARRFRARFLPKVQEFPVVEVVREIAFIGLDSTADELHWYDRYFADGELGEGQLAGLARVLAGPELADKVKVVYLHHHPLHFLPFFQLKDRARLKALIAGKIDVLLFGHLHFGGTYHRTWDIKVVIDGGSSTGRLALGLFGVNVKHRVIDLADYSVAERNYLQ